MVSDLVPAPATTWSPHVEARLGDCPTALAWAPDGQRLAAASLAGDVVVVETATGISRPVATHPGGALCLDWTADSLVSGGQDGTIVLHTERIELGGWVSALARAGDLLAVAHGRAVTVLDVTVQPARIVVSDTHDTTVTCLCWHPTRTDTILAGSFGRIAMIACGSGERCDLPLQFGGAVATLHVAPTSGWWAAGTRGDFAYIWHEKMVNPVAVPTGRSSGRLVAFGDDVLATGSARMTAVFDFAASDPLGMPSGQWLTSIGEPTAMSWRPGTGRLVCAVTIGDGHDENGLLVFEPRRCPGPIGFVATARRVEQMAWSPDGLLALASGDGNLGVGESTAA